MNSALQRARKTVEERVHGPSQVDELAALGDERTCQLIDAFVDAWERADVQALLDLLADDAVFTMPPLPAWFDGRESVRRFVVERLFAETWRLLPTRINGQIAVAAYMRDSATGGFPFSGLNVLSLRNGLVTAVNAFVDPEAIARLGYPPEFPG